MRQIAIIEPAIFIRIAKLYSEGMSPQELYEVTRGVWCIAQRRETVQLALAVAGGIIREVFAVGTWHPAGTTPYFTRQLSAVRIPGRWEFVGELASDAVRSKYVGQVVAHYFSRGAVNPITYVNA